MITHQPTRLVWKFDVFADDGTTVTASISGHANSPASISLPGYETIDYHCNPSALAEALRAISRYAAFFPCKDHPNLPPPPQNPTDN